MGAALRFRICSACLLFVYGRGDPLQLLAFVGRRSVVLMISMRCLLCALVTLSLFLSLCLYPDSDVMCQL